MTSNLADRELLRTLLNKLALADFTRLVEQDEPASVSPAPAAAQPPVTYHQPAVSADAAQQPWRMTLEQLAGRAGTGSAGSVKP